MEKPTEKKILQDCRDVSLGYEGQALWQGLTFQVRSGDYLCVEVRTAPASPRC